MKTLTKTTLKQRLEPYGVKPKGKEQTTGQNKGVNKIAYCDMLSCKHNDLKGRCLLPGGINVDEYGTCFHCEIE